jgi:predicted DCC family thiol-disulfide oxidoreductase YuxK
MKTLKNQLILFDADCPMCSVYTKAFIKTGMLDTDSRLAYQSVTDNMCPLLDRQRAVNEIGLVDKSTGEVSYGITSLFKVIGNSFPFLTFLFEWKLFNLLMSKVYAFISYNRRVIIPASPTEGNYPIQPSFKLQYRLAYLLFTWFVTGLILRQYAFLLAQMVPVGNAGREYLICGGQVFFQGLIIICFAKDQFWNYLGNMMTISFAGSLLLTIPLIVNHWLTIPAIISTIYFLCVAGLMLLEHLRRCKLLGLGQLLSATWVTYRVLVLVLIYHF